MRLKRKETKPREVLASFIQATLANFFMLTFVPLILLLVITLS